MNEAKYQVPAKDDFDDRPCKLATGPDTEPTCFGYCSRFCAAAAREEDQKKNDQKKQLEQRLQHNE